MTVASGRIKTSLRGSKTQTTNDDRPMPRTKLIPVCGGSPWKQPRVLPRHPARSLGSEPEDSGWPSLLRSPHAGTPHETRISGLSEPRTRTDAQETWYESLNQAIKYSYSCPQHQQITGLVEGTFSRSFYGNMTLQDCQGWPGRILSV